MRIAGVLAAIVVALALQSALARFAVARGFGLDLVLVVVVFAGLAWGPVAGLLTGSVAGLAQDAISGGIVGVGGLAKTIVGFFVGAVGSQFIITQAAPRFFVFFGATVMHALCFLGLYAVIEARRFGWPWPVVLTQGTANGVLGLLVFKLVETLPGVLERRRSGRGSVGKRWTNG